jgi:hypothetical protein
VAADANIAERMARRWLAPAGQARRKVSPPQATRERKADGLHLYATSAYFLLAKQYSFILIPRMRLYYTFDIK